MSFSFWDFLTEGKIFFFTANPSFWWELFAFLSLPLPLVLFIPLLYPETCCCSTALGLFSSLLASHQTSDPWLPCHLGLLALLPLPLDQWIWAAMDCCLHCCPSLATTSLYSSTKLIVPDFHCSPLSPARRVMPLPSFLCSTLFRVSFL